MQQLDQGRLAEVLLVEDNENDVILTREGFLSANFHVNLHHVKNGKECLAFLRQEGKYTDAPRPDLILLDLNMPVMSGHEVLEAMSNDENLQQHRVVVLTTSSSERDILNAYKWMPCSSYIMKPVDFDNFTSAIENIGGYWLSLVVKPGDDTKAA